MEIVLDLNVLLLCIKQRCEGPRISFYMIRNKWLILGHFAMNGNICSIKNTDYVRRITIVKTSLYGYITSIASFILHHLTMWGDGGFCFTAIPGNSILCICNAELGPSSHSKQVGLG